MKLEQQRVLFDLVDASVVGASLLPSLVMQPVKTVSAVVGIAAAEGDAVFLSPCARCPQVDCPGRRE